MSTINRHHVKFITRGLVLAAASFSVAACSSTVDRFAGYPPTSTASVPKTPQKDVVQKKTLAGAPAQGAVRPTWQQPAGVRTPTKTASSGTVTVQSGQTMYSLARANNMSVGQLASANNMSYPYTLKVGQRLKVPGVASPSSPAPTFAPQSPRVRAANSQPQTTRPNFASSRGHTVRRGETLFSLGRTYGKNPYSIARHNNLQAPYALKPGQVVLIPGSGASGPVAQAPRAVPFERKRIEISPKNDDRIPMARAPEVRRSQVPQTQPLTQTTDSTFRWPVKGRVISGFGRKPSGLRNEGINIAVPEGTSVRSAEAGIVAYAGNELKGYGNLVLVRHKNGWVTAYAHNKELFVKRGDTVKRGTVIAKAGQTGSVKSPQLHFEVRKGSSAVDPMKYLTSRRAALD